MDYITLGNSDLKVSRFCVGCMSFGDPESNMHAWTLNPEESESHWSASFSLTCAYRMST